MDWVAGRSTGVVGRTACGGSGACWLAGPRPSSADSRQRQCCQCQRIRCGDGVVKLQHMQQLSSELAIHLPLVARRQWLPRVQALTPPRGRQRGWPALNRLSARCPPHCIKDRPAIDAADLEHLPSARRLRLQLLLLHSRWRVVGPACLLCSPRCLSLRAAKQGLRCADRVLPDQPPQPARSSLSSAPRLHASGPPVPAPVPAHRSRPRLCFELPEAAFPWTAASASPTSCSPCRRKSACTQPPARASRRKTRPRTIAPPPGATATSTNRPTRLLPP